MADNASSSSRATASAGGTSFAAVYFFWGSTYLAISLAIETMPPFLMAAARFVVAGAVHPSAVHWRTAAITGGLMLLGGNGVVVWAEQMVPSGQAAVLVSTVPLWVVVISSVAARQRPARPVLAGIVIGLLGLHPHWSRQRQRRQRLGHRLSRPPLRRLLVGARHPLLPQRAPARLPDHVHRPEHARRRPPPHSLGGLLGEFASVDLPAVSLKSWLALLYLIIFGSLVGYSSYMWLVKATTPAKASSNFYVNPVVAVFLGWMLAGEAITPSMLIATAIIVGAVALIVSQGSRRPGRTQPAAQEAPPPC